jgi:NAD(P)-dependent dehydrogenase (short-subunit alcohol dehydrogenase family)
VTDDLAGKVILLTGASKGIGAATAAALGSAGASLIAHYGCDREGAEAATAAVPPERCRLIAADLSRPDAPDRLWQEALAWQGRIDVLVNNAAVMRWDGGLDAADEAWDRVWAETLQVNVLAPARLLRNAVRHFRERGGGTVITISSWAAQRGSTNPDTIAYAASKAAIRAATQTIARGCAKDNILAYSVAPGVVRTRMSEAFAATHGGEAAVSAGLATGEWVPPDDVANLVAFLATGRCRHLTGATLDVNGASYVR